MRRIPIGIVCLLALGVAPAVSGDNGARQASGQGAAVNIVQVLGCLTEGRYNTWILERATEAVVANDQSLTPEVLKDAEAKALGTKEYRLVVVSEYDPWAHRGHKVVVRGVLTNEAAESRISVTALRRVSFSCLK